MGCRHRHPRRARSRDLIAGTMPVGGHGSDQHDRVITDLRLHGLQIGPVIGGLRNSDHTEPQKLRSLVESWVCSPRAQYFGLLHTGPSFTSPIAGTFHGQDDALSTSRGHGSKCGISTSEEGGGKGKKIVLQTLDTRIGNTAQGICLKKLHGSA